LDRWLKDADLRQQWFGCFMTETKGHLAIEPPEAPFTVEALQAHLEDGGALHRHPFARFAWSRTSSGHYLLFTSGEVHPLPGVSGGLLEALCSEPRLDATTLAGGLENRAFVECLVELVNLGELEVADG
jgi:50S ribosomal protein L16 3-hydroxylase